MKGLRLIILLIVLGNIFLSKYLFNFIPISYGRLVPSFAMILDTTPKVSSSTSQFQLGNMVFRIGPDREVGPLKPETGMKIDFLSLENRFFC